jgi:polar amino acid transport system substrate-binding protein
MEYAIDLRARHASVSALRGGRPAPAGGAAKRPRQTISGGELPGRAAQGDLTMFKRLSLSCLALVVALAASFTVVQAKSLDDIIKDGVIRIGINPNFPPNSSRGSGGDWEGFDIDIGNKIAEALGVKVEWVPTETPQRVPFLVADRIDISLGALTRSAERAKLIEYTVPLHTEVMAVLTTEKVDIKDWKELNDSKYTLANMRGNWSVDYLKKELPNAKMELVDTIADTVRLVAQGRADAIVENIDFFMKHTKNYPDVKWKVLPNPIDIGWDAIGVQRGNYPLRDFLNIVLYNLHTSNFVNDTWEKWYGAPMLVKVVPNPYF